MVQNQMQEKHQYQNSAKGHTTIVALVGVSIFTLKITPKAEHRPTSRQEQRQNANVRNLQRYVRSNAELRPDWLLGQAA
jgi:hypothetical protein